LCLQLPRTHRVRLQASVERLSIRSDLALNQERILRRPHSAAGCCRRTPPHRLPRSADARFCHLTARLCRSLTIPRQTLRMDSMRNFPAHAPDQTGRAADRLHALRSPKHQRSVPLPAQGGEDNERLSALVDHDRQTGVRPQGDPAPAARRPLSASCRAPDIEISKITSLRLTMERSSA
jgi:hypothetical protein